MGSAITARYLGAGELGLGLCVPPFLFCLMKFGYEHPEVWIVKFGCLSKNSAPALMLIYQTPT
jgi:hypothetical protein